jgi:hypothetical protein
MWKAGMGVTLIGVSLALSGALLAVFSVSPGYGGYVGDPTEGGPGSHTTDKGAAMFVIGTTFAAVGDAATFAVGPGLWIAGARRAPLELRF